MASILDFLRTFGINAKTNFDLKDYADYLNLKIKILMNDELSSLKEKDIKNIIINYQNSNEKGSHWVCIYKNLTREGTRKGGEGDLTSNKSIYFDSFGIKPTKEVEDYLSKDYTFNSLQVQPNNTKICGILSLYVLYRLNKGKGQGQGFSNLIQEIYNDLKSLL